MWKAVEVDKLLVLSLKYIGVNIADVFFKKILAILIDTKIENNTKNNYVTTNFNVHIGITVLMMSIFVPLLIQISSIIIIRI